MNGNGSAPPAPACDDCETRAEVMRLNSHRINSLNEWADLRSKLDAHVEYSQEALRSLHGEVSRVLEIVLHIERRLGEEV